MPCPLIGVELSGVFHLTPDCTNKDVKIVPKENFPFTELNFPSPNAFLYHLHQIDVTEKLVGGLKVKAILNQISSALYGLFQAIAGYPLQGNKITEHTVDSATCSPTSNVK
eukprot:Gb_09720 [translate_table: standard]